MSEIRTFALRRPSWRVWLAGTLAVIVLGTLFIARIAGGGSDGDGGTTTGSTTGSSQQPGGTESGAPTPSETPEVDGLDGPEATGDAKVAAPAAMALATAFATDWATRPPADQPELWRERVTRHTDEVLGEQLRAVDLSTLAATKVTGPAVSAQGGVTSAEVRVPTDAGSILVVCVLVDGEWKVADYELERRPS